MSLFSHTNVLSVTDIFCCFNNQVQNLKNVYKNVPRFCHSCCTQAPWVMFSVVVTAHKMKFSIKDFFSKYDQVRSFLRIWSHLLKKPWWETSTFVQWTCFMSLVITKLLVYECFYEVWKGTICMKWVKIYFHLATMWWANVGLKVHVCVQLSRIYGKNSKLCRTET